MDTTNREKDALRWSYWICFVCHTQALTSFTNVMQCKFTKRSFLSFSFHSFDHHRWWILRPCRCSLRVPCLMLLAKRRPRFVGIFLANNLIVFILSGRVRDLQLQLLQRWGKFFVVAGSYMWDIDDSLQRLKQWTNIRQFVHLQVVELWNAIDHRDGRSIIGVGC